MASHQGRNRRHLAARRGIDLQARRDRSLLRATRLAEGMRREIVTVPLDADLERLRTMFRHRHLPVFVVDQQGQLYGSISFEDFADAALEPERESRRPRATWSTASRGAAARGRPRDRAPLMRDEPGGAHAGGRRLPVPQGDRRGARPGDLVLAYNRALLAARAAECGKS